MYDVIVIGAGWAGINAAIASCNLGLKAALIEEDRLGGVCLNYGCIPTKTYYHSAKLFQAIKKSSEFGIDIKEASINFSNIHARKGKIVKNIASGLEYVLKKSAFGGKIDYYRAFAQIESSKEVLIDGKVLETKNLILACGSKPKEVKNFKFDGKRVLSSTDILEIKSLPKSLLIIGGGAVGCEFAWIFASFGVKITILEKEPHLLPTEDEEVVKKLELEFKKLGIDVNTSCDLDKFDTKSFEKILLCVGRVPTASRLNLNSIGLDNLNTNDYLETKVPGIYLAGDLRGKIMLAHAASAEGKLCAANIYNSLNNIKKQTLDYNLVPNCVFVYPEIASCGIASELKAKENKINYEIKKIYLKANGISNILQETNGLIKIFIEKESSKIIGGVIYAPYASELINILVLLLNSKYDLLILKKLIFNHPTISESLLEIE